MPPILRILMVLPALFAFASCNEVQSKAEQEKYPAVARVLADKFYDSIPYMRRSSSQDRVRQAFVDGFFLGFTNPGGSMMGGGIGTVEGFAAGQEFRRTHPAELQTIMAAYGYQFVSLEGVWSVSFEHNGFKPTQAKGEEWWLNTLGDLETDLPKDYFIPKEGVRISVEGFVSPEGMYGHLGGYRREIFAKKIMRVNTIETERTQAGS